MNVHKKAGLMDEELVKVILFAAMAFFVVLFLHRYFAATYYIPAWSKSLSSVEKAITTLDPKYLDLSRTANVQMKGYSIVGYSEKEKCFDDFTYCICACQNPDCKNLENNRKKYCRAIDYIIPQGFVIPESENPVTYRMKLVSEDGKTFSIKADGISSE